ncbi:MAG: carbohydrate ABC transporter permease [Rectinemataceae bacterium]
MKFRFKQVLRFALLVAIALLFFVPVYWMISTSLKPESDTVARPVQWIPKRPTLRNYAEVLTSPDGNIKRWFWNSVYTSSMYAFFHVLFCSLAAYPLARMKFKGRDAWFWFVLSSLMIPGVVTLIPLYIMMIKFNWIDTYNAMIWPGVSGAFGVFMLRQFFLGIPRELEEAAALDGAGSLQVFFRIIMPMSVPAIVTLSVFAFMACWNNYTWPLFVMHGDMQTLPVGISSFSSRYNTDYGKLMAGTAVAAIPVILVYLFAQRFLERGMTLTGSKE